MDYSYSEQEYRWAQEVLYLHSLWHRGPPLSTSPYIPHPIHHHHHHPALQYSTPSYPNPNPNPNNKRQRQEPAAQGKEWPCDPAAVVPEQSSPADVWPPFEPAAARQNPPLSPNSAAREKSISISIATQRSAIQACRGFFLQNLDSESVVKADQLEDTLPRSTKKQKHESSHQEKECPCDPTSSVPSQSPPLTWSPLKQAIQKQNPSSPNSSAQNTFLPTQLSAIQLSKNFFSQVYSDSSSETETDADEFFMCLLENSLTLRGCYEQNTENGEFYCLVCEARSNGNKGKGRVYKGCAALVRHASTIRRVGWRVAHRVFARSVCRVLAWDLRRLPSIVVLQGSVVKDDHLEKNQETVAIHIPNSTSNNPEIQNRYTNDGPPNSITEQEIKNIPLHAGNEAVDYASGKQEQISMISDDAINQISGSPVEGKEEDTSIDA